MSHVSIVAENFNSQPVGSVQQRHRQMMADGSCYERRPLTHYHTVHHPLSHMHICFSIYWYPVLFHHCSELLFIIPNSTPPLMKIWRPRHKQSLTSRERCSVRDGQVGYWCKNPNVIRSSVGHRGVLTHSVINFYMQITVQYW